MKKEALLQVQSSEAEPLSQKFKGMRDAGGF